MKRSLFRIAMDRLVGASVKRHRRISRTFATEPGSSREPLERRDLLANISPAAVISSRPDGPNFDYTITLTNLSSSSASIGTFWYAWVPDNDFLATRPLSVTPPAGWSDQITHSGATDGYAILFTSNGASSNVPVGGSLTFHFTSADRPASVNGNSPFFPGTPVGTSFVYPEAPFSDAGHQFMVMDASSASPTPAPNPAPAAPTLVALAINPNGARVPKRAAEQFTATGSYTDSSTKDLTGQVTWSSSRPAVARINGSGVATTSRPGTTIITASVDGVTSSTELVVGQTARRPAPRGHHPAPSRPGHGHRPPAHSRHGY
jgi:hypothetical protein